MKQVLSPRELARAIGVSESSLKRWADNGLVKTARTAGGHRRIAIADAIRFIRESGALLVHPELLGLVDVSAARADTATQETQADAFFIYLRDGRAAEARGLLLSSYLGGESLAEIFDSIVAGALSRLGELWKSDETGIILEHRAMDICIEAIELLRATLDPKRDGPVAVGGAPPGDPYLLPSLLAATILAGEGYQTMNLGPQTPIQLLAQAADNFDAKLVWVSISAAQQPDELREAVIHLARQLDSRGTKLMVGGQECEAVALPIDENILIGRSMAELAAFARGLLAATRGQGQPAA